MVLKKTEKKKSSSHVEKGEIDGKIQLREGKGTRWQLATKSISLPESCNL